MKTKKIMKINHILTIISFVIYLLCFMFSHCYNFGGLADFENISPKYCKFNVFNPYFIGQIMIIVMPLIIVVELINMFFKIKRKEKIIKEIVFLIINIFLFLVFNDLSNLYNIFI